MASYLHDYDFTYAPCAPVAEIVVSSAQGTAAVSLVALLDSGADATMLPFSILEQIQAEALETRFLRTVTGKRTVVELYRVSIQLGPYHFRAVRAIATDSPDEIILGRDVLNQLIITLNGLAAVTEIRQ